MRALLVLVLLSSTLLAGCSGGGGGTTPAGDDAPQAVLAPWWDIGDSWTIEFEQVGHAARTTKLVNFANDTFGDPPHFWLGTASRQEALDHVFFDDNPFLGRIHWEILAPHEKGMHSAMYDWPLEDGHRWTSPILFGKEDLGVEATRRADGTFLVQGTAQADGSEFEYDYDPSTEWFRSLTITEPDGRVGLRATVKDHGAGEHGAYYFLRGRDYLDSKGGTTGQEETFQVKDEGATSIAFLLDVQAGPLSRIEFVDPSGNTFHQEILPTGGTSDKVVEVSKTPPPGAWKLRYVGSVSGQILVRGILEYKATI